MKMLKVTVCSVLTLWAVSGFSFASQGASGAGVKRSLSDLHKVVFVNDCPEKDKVNGQCKMK
jgi:hypothetical protein